MGSLTYGVSALNNSAGNYQEQPFVIFKSSLSVSGLALLDFDSQESRKQDSSFIGWLVMATEIPEISWKSLLIDFESPFRINSFLEPSTMVILNTRVLQLLLLLEQPSHPQYSGR